MSSAPDLTGILEDLEWYSTHSTVLCRLIEVLKTVCADDPQFLIGAVDSVEEDEEDAKELTRWILAGEDVNYSTVLWYAAMLYQHRHPEEFEWESK